MIYETPGFETYFRQATPLLEIADLKIGSRPASRTKSTRIEDLRAIPWVFSWSQSRVMLPGWFGFGTAASKVGIEQLKPIYGKSAFFRTVLANMEMVLAKSSLQIASRYSHLVEDRTLAHKVMAEIEAEWHRSRDALLAITDQAATCWRAKSPRLAEIDKKLAAYVNGGWNHLQGVDLLRRRRREGDTEQARWHARRHPHVDKRCCGVACANSG